ncbi:MAG: heme o synthase [Pseudomonadota bacterium]
MTTLSTPAADTSDVAVSSTARGDVGDYIALLKPRVMSLVIFTAIVGMLAAPTPIHPVLACIAILCIAVGAGASGALNMWFDADIDAQMQRTAARPVPRGHVTADQALVFGVVLSVTSVMTLALFVNWASAALLALTIAFYVFIYTMWLKRRTAQNIVIGGAAGAFPPMIGWAAATGNVSLESVVMFAIIFLWTPPHFWALALYRARDYERVGVPMLPVVAGAQATRLQILLYSIALVAVAAVPGFIGLGGIAYMVASTLAGAGFICLAWRVYVTPDGRENDRAAKRLFGYSIFYLFAVFALMLVEHAGAALIKVLA